MLKKHCCWILMLTILFAVSEAAEKNIANNNPAIDPKADNILQQMGNYLAGAREFSLEAHKMTDFLLDTGQKIQLSDTTKAVVKRPNKIWAQSTGDTQNEQVWYKGTTLAILNQLENAYGVIDVPDNIDEMMDYIVEKLDIAVPLADLLFSDPYKMAMENVRSGQYIGLHCVKDVKCHHLAFRQEGLDWQIWIEDSDKPLPRKLVITYKELPGHPQFIALLGKWDLTSKVSDDLFVFKAPEGASKIDLVPAAKETIKGQTPSAKNKTEDERSK
jgi:hypothetical protein